MREATGNALLTMMVTSVITVIMIFFVGSLSYSKSYKIKNYIVNEIEENGKWDNDLQVKIDSHMKEVGYSVKKKENNCNNVSGIDFGKCTPVNVQSNYDYCVYECSGGSYYKVVTFMKFDFPVIGDFVKFDIKGETKTFNYFSG